MSRPKLKCVSSDILSFSSLHSCLRRTLRHESHDLYSYGKLTTPTHRLQQAYKILPAVQKSCSLITNNNTLFKNASESFPNHAIHPPHPDPDSTYGVHTHKIISSCRKQQCSGTHSPRVPRFRKPIRTPRFRERTYPSSLNSYHYYSRQLLDPHPPITLHT